MTEYIATVCWHGDSIALYEGLYGYFLACWPDQPGTTAIGWYDSQSKPLTGRWLRINLTTGAAQTMGPPICWAVIPRPAESELKIWTQRREEDAASNT